MCLPCCAAFGGLCQGGVRV
ncbi:rCG25131 [Rattus norvegicus]|uniref:RCG25131 n=1 Tax=Rattus norvegicus TaxID=10116 RepID=A6I207_RAT|nr:rCG25131 [Rattus norvegicus]